MHIYIISILLYTITKADDSDFKYIDLLPEKEKQDFLEKIARRILEEVQTKDDRPRVSREISDEQLNEHDAFVQKIMKEESENLRRQSNSKDVESNQNKNIGRIMSSEKDKNIQHVDLTLSADNNRAKRENLRKVFTGFAPDADSTYHDSKESDVDIQAKNFKIINNPDYGNNILEKVETVTSYDNNSNNNNETEENQKINITSIENINKNREITSIENQNNEKETNLQSNANQQETEITTQNNLSKNHSISFYKSKPEFKNETSTDNQQAPIKNQRDPGFTTQDNSRKLLTNEKVIDPAQLEVIQKTYENKNYDDSEKIKENAPAVLSVEESKTPETTTTKTTNSALRSSNIIYMSDIKPNKTITKEIKDSDVINIQITKFQDTEDVPSTTHSDDNINQNLNVTDAISTTTEESPLLTTTTSVNTHINTSKEKDRQQITVPKPKRYKLRNKPKEFKKKLNGTHSSTESNNFASAVIKALRLKLLEKSNKNENNDYYKSAHYSRMKPVVHEVFEISPDETPFIKQNPRNRPQFLQPQNKQLKGLKLDKKPHKLRQPVKKQPKYKQPAVEEQPFHVPIYNYLPNNAFYNPHNVLGPNAEIDDEDDNEVIWTKKDGGLEFPSLMPKSAKKLNHVEKLEAEEQPYHVPIYYYSPKNAYYNPNNYYGPNLQDNNVKRDKDYNDYDGASYELDKNDITNKQRDQIEWQYYYDPHVSVKEGKEQKKKTTNEGELFEVNLPKSVEDFIKKDTNIDLKAYIDANYNNKSGQRCSCKGCKCNSNPDKYECNSEEEFTNNADDEKKMPIVNTMSKIRHLMAGVKYFVHNKPTNTSHLEALLEVPDPKISNKALRSLASIHFDDLFKTDTEKNHKMKSLDYYERYYDDFKSAEKELKTNSNFKYYEIDPIKRIYYENTNKNRGLKNNNKIREQMKKYNKQRKQLQNNKQLKEFIQTYKPHKFNDNSTKTPGEYKEIAKSILRHFKKKLNQTEYEMVKKIADLVRDDEIIKLYFQLQEIERKEAKKKAERTSEIRDELSAYEEVLGDMVKENHKALTNYDWLGTAVDLQSAIKKMSDMVESLQHEEAIHPSDLDLIKYIVYLYTNAQEEVTQNTAEKELRGSILPHGNRGKHIIKHMRPDLRVPGVHGRLRPRDIPAHELDDFEAFLEELQTTLYELHTALKYIAMVTKHKNQRWFENLKQIHIDSKRKRLLELILHLCTTRLLGMIEETASKGLEDDFVEYVKKNVKEVDRTKEEFVFVLKLLDEIKRIE